MNTFPTILTGPGDRFFSDEKSPNAVSVGSTASGRPVLNKLFTFDPRMFDFELRFVSQADKLTVMTFYEENKDVPFNWLNEQDDEEYEVVFIGPPRCRVDGEKDLWRIGLVLFQNARVA